MGGPSRSGARGAAWGLRGEDESVCGTTHCCCGGAVPSSSPQSCSSSHVGGQGKGNRNLKSSESLRMCVAILVSPFSWSLLISLLVSCSGHVCCLSECLHPFPSDTAWFVLPWAWRGIRDYEKCSGAVDELLWVSPSQLPSFSLGASVHSLSFSLGPPCRHLPLTHLRLQAVLCRLPSHQSLLKACVPARGLDACLLARRG